MSGFYKLGDFLKDLNSQKKNILRQDPDAHKDYEPFVINRILSGFLDTILHVNQLNMRQFADKQMQYDYLINAIKRRGRYNDKLIASNNKNIPLLMEYYGYNRERVLEILPMISEDKIKDIKKSRDKGGR